VGSIPEFGVGAKSSGDWLLAQEAIDWVTSSCGIGEDEYRVYVEELRATFPEQWVAKEGALIRANRLAVAEFRLHAFFLHRLSHHPIPLLLDGTYKGSEPLRELARLGRDLMRTRNYSRIGSLRARLKTFEEFPGALFELEVLSELHRAQLPTEILKPPLPDFAVHVGKRVLIEARHRGVPKSMILAMDVFAAFGPAEGGLPPGLAIKVDPWILALEPVERGVAEVVQRVKRGLNSGNVEYRDDGIQLEHRSELAVDGNSVRIETTEFSYGEDLSHLVYLTLKEKERQLIGLRDESTRCVIALDLQSLVPVLSPTKADRLIAEVAEIRSKVIAGIQSFVHESVDVSAVLCWWTRRGDLPAEDRFVQPADITLITANEEFALNQRDQPRLRLDMLT
jgi:hypothetical protein